METSEPPRVTDPLAEGVPVDLRIAASGDVAVAYVVQVHLGQARRGQLASPALLFSSQAPSLSCMLKGRSLILVMWYPSAICE